jgi:isochorismate synthase EntC
MSDVLKHLEAEEVTENLKKLASDLSRKDYQNLLADKYIDLFDLRHDTAMGKDFVKLADEMFQLQREANQHRLKIAGLETEKDGLEKDFRLLWEMKFGQERHIPEKVLKSLGLEEADVINQEDTIYEKFETKYKKAASKDSILLYSDKDLSEWRSLVSDNLLSLDESGSNKAVLAVLPEIENLNKKINKIEAVKKDENRERLMVDLEATEEHNRLTNIINNLKENCPSLED